MTTGIQTPGHTNKALNNTVVDSLKFLEKFLGNIIAHTEAVHHNTIPTTTLLESPADFPQYVNNKLQSVLELFKENSNGHYCDLIAKTANNETFSITTLIEQFKQIEWITSGYHLLETKLIDSPNFEQGITAVNNLLLQYLTSKLVAFYAINNNSSLKLVHQCSTNKDITLPKAINKGVGALGALLENNYTFLGATPEELLTETNEECFPKYMFCLPVLMNNVIEGILLLGKDIAFTTHEQKFLNLCQTHLAAYLVYNRTKGQLSVLQETLTNHAEKLKLQSEELIAQKETLLYNRARADALEKKTLSLNDAVNQKTQLIDILEEKIDGLNNSLAIKTKANASLEKNIAHKEQDLGKTLDKANALEKQLLEKTQMATAINEKVATIEIITSAQLAEIEAINTELHQAQAIIKKQTDALNSANSKSNYLDCLANALKATINKHFVVNINAAEHTNTINNIQLGKDELLNLITDIQELANIQNNTASVKITPTSLAEVFSSLKQHFDNIAVNKGITFSIEQNNDICNYQKTDTDKLQKILIGLLAYSFKSTDVGAIQIKAYQPDHVNNKHIFAISISDTGAGMSLEQQKTIFEPFTAGNLDQYTGTGLTLKLAYEYAKLLSADLHVKSQVGLGTTFTLYLPMANCNTEELHDTYSKASDTNIAPFIDPVNKKKNMPQQQQTILVMHDDTIYKGINKLLKAVVKETNLVTTADMAYKKIKANNFNCVIMSLQHPDLPGFKWLLSQLKREDLSIPPFILYIPYTMNTRENELAKRYMRDYGVRLAKTTDELLEEVIHNLCGQLNEA